MVKLSNVIDQADDSEVAPLAVGEVRALAARYRDLNCGVSASADEEATSEQIAAVRSKIELDVVPYADFAVLRPHGARLGRALKFVAKVWSPEKAEYVNREIPGPATFEEWRRSWRVFRYILLVLGVVSSPKLEKYYEKVHGLYRSHGNLGGADLWWLLSLAESRMRSERMEHIRRELEDDYERYRAVGRQAESMFDPNHPWDSVFFVASGDDEYWGREVKEAALTYMANLRSRQDLTDEGHHAVIPGAGRGGKGKGDKDGKDKNQPKPKYRNDRKKTGRQDSERKESPHKESPPKKEGKKDKGKGKARGREVCWAWTKFEGCTTPCPNGRRHPDCPKCKKNHAWTKPCPS